MHSTLAQGGRIGRILLIISLVAVALLATALPAKAEVSKFFNKAHSLRGDCLAIAPDDVPDPGCPEVAHPPEGSLAEPGGVATDPYGNVYLVNRNQSQGANQYHIDIFNPEGRYIGGLPQPEAQAVAVDSTGHLYVTYRGGAGSIGASVLARYDPLVYEPAAGEIAYGTDPIFVEEDGSFSPTGATISVDPTTDHLYLSPGSTGGNAFGGIREYGPAVDGEKNKLITDEIAKSVQFVGMSALDAFRHRIYVVESFSSSSSEPPKARIKVFDSRPPYAEIPQVNNGPFQTTRLLLAVDETSGHLFVGDLAFSAPRIYEFDLDGTNLGSLIRPPNISAQFAWMTIDNSEESPNHRYLYVTSGIGSIGNLFAYEPKPEPKPPIIESLSFSGLTEDEAVLRASINPQGLATHWVFEYVDEATFEAEGFASAQTAGEGNLGPGSEGVDVFALATDLAPGESYRYRVRAENECLPGGCTDEEQGSFTTFKPDVRSEVCPNQALRTGPSAALPDCRAYELVTPADTAGLSPLPPGESDVGPKFGTPAASPVGDSFAFMILGGLIPGQEATGAFPSGDLYVADRGSSGWQTAPKTPTGPEASQAKSGGLSSDHSYVPLEISGMGTLVTEGEAHTAYVRYPDGSLHLTGEGSLGTDPDVRTLYISPGGTHSLFAPPSVGSPALQLEPDAPPSGTIAIYDRTLDGELHVVSLLPGEVTPGAGATYVGTSRDASTVAFRIGGSQIYLRVNNTETLEGAPGGSTFAGLSSDGRYLFYMLGGDLHRFDTQSGQAESITETGDATAVNVAADGVAAYFLSPTALPTNPNPQGAEPQDGAQNLYRWDDGSIEFVATVTERDAKGQPHPSFGSFNGLGLLTISLPNAPALLSSRTTPNGATLLFESRANLTGFASAGKVEIYRYDVESATLRCLSCDPTGALPQTDAALIAPLGTENTIPNRWSEMANLSADGKRAFFETGERLVVEDNNGITDVYQWEAEGKGNCVEPGGCLFLISSGQSSRPNHLVGVSESGDDVFILTADLLVPADRDDTPSVYDARVDGGFVPPVTPAGECLGEACLPAAVAPDDPTPGSSSFNGLGNVKPSKNGRRCPKGRRAVRKAGSTRCVKPRKRLHKTRAHANRRAH
jgi:hypothetical protein